MTNKAEANVMSPENSKLLVEKYPKIFKWITNPPKDGPHLPISLFIFECEDGWFTILDVLCANIQWHIDRSRTGRARALQYNRVLKRAVHGDLKGLEWYHTYNDTEKAIEWAKKTAARHIAEPRYEPVPEEVHQVVAVQVKEKFGGLRFYVNGGDEKIHNYISMAESMSYRMCEVCGSPGKLYTDGWYTTLCPTHAKEKDRTDDAEENEDAE
jgi:hypothetical protein